MNFTEKMVAMTVATLLADGKTEQEELDNIKQVAADMELDAAEVEACIAKELAKPTPLEKVACTIRKKEDAKIIMEACELVALADKYLDHKEIDLMLHIAELLKVAPSKVVLDLATITQNDRSILIEGNATLHGDEEIIIPD